MEHKINDRKKNARDTIPEVRIKRRRTFWILNNNKTKGSERKWRLLHSIFFNMYTIKYITLRTAEF
jgi:hypothetical protein